MKPPLFRAHLLWVAIIWKWKHDWWREIVPRQYNNRFLISRLQIYELKWETNFSSVFAGWSLELFQIERNGKEQRRPGVEVVSGFSGVGLICDRVARPKCIITLPLTGKWDAMRSPNCAQARFALFYVGLAPKAENQKAVEHLISDEKRQHIIPYYFQKLKKQWTTIFGIFNFSADISKVLEKVFLYFEIHYQPVKSQNTPSTFGIYSKSRERSKIFGLLKNGR